MPAEQEVDLKDLARRLKQVENALERIGERATRREDDWGTVRANAEKVGALRDEVRELRHLIGRPQDTQEQPVSSAPVRQQMQSTASLVDAVLLRMQQQEIPTSRAEAVDMLREAFLSMMQDPTQRGKLQEIFILMFGEQFRALGVDLSRFQTQSQPRRRPSGY